MNRTAVTALVAAAVIGTSGGVATALLNGPALGGTPAQSAGGATPSGGSTPSTTGSPEGSTKPRAAATAGSPASPPASPTADASLLYATATAIHDGDRVVRHGLRRLPSSVQRVAGGWLLATRLDRRSSDHALTVVREDGSREWVTRVSGLWDLDETGTRVAGVDDADAVVRVWRLSDGDIVGELGESRGANAALGFSGRDLVVSLDTRDGRRLLHWNPRTGATSGEQEGYYTQSTSPGGSYVAGPVDAEGISSNDGRCLGLTSTYLKKNSVGWFTCDSRVYGDGGGVFSPDGTRLQVVASITDGFGPGGFTILDASDGPQRAVATVSLKPNTPALGAEWADDDHLFVYGTRGYDDPEATWVDRCDFQGDCERVVEGDEPLVVGRGT